MFRIKEKYSKLKEKLFFKSFNFILRIYDTEEFKENAKLNRYSSNIFKYVVDNPFTKRKFYILDYFTLTLIFGFGVIGSILTGLFFNTEYGIILFLASIFSGGMLTLFSQFYLNFVSFFVRLNYQKNFTRMKSTNYLLQVMYPKLKNTRINASNQSTDEIFYYNHFFKISELSNLFENIILKLNEIYSNTQDIENEIEYLSELYLSKTIQINTEKDMRIGVINREIIPFLIKNEISMEILHQILLKANKITDKTKKESDIIVKNTIKSYCKELNELYNNFYSSNKFKLPIENEVADMEVQELIQLQQKIFA